MSVKLTNEAELERIGLRKIPKWGLLTTTSLVQAVHFARDNGWKENKVQVRFEKPYEDVVEYIVEPYEESCSCRSLLKYKDYYGVED